MSAIEIYAFPQYGQITARTVRSESRTVSQTTGDTTVTYHQIRSVIVATAVSIGVYHGEAPDAQACVTDSTAITNAQADGEEDNDNRLSSNVTWNPVTGKAVRTNTFVASIVNGNNGRNGWINESRDQN